jgi:hypothetical protein
MAGFVAFDFLLERGQVPQQGFKCLIDDRFDILANALHECLVGLPPKPAVKNEQD